MLPSTASVVEDGEFELQIELINPPTEEDLQGDPQGKSIEGLEFVLEYEDDMIQLNEVELNENLEFYQIEQAFCTDCISDELSVLVYFIGLKEDFIEFTTKDSSVTEKGSGFVERSGVFLTAKRHLNQLVLPRPI